MRCKLAIIAATALALSACTDQANGGGGPPRDQIRIVGSSTVYPFSTFVAEQFAQANPGSKVPVVESIGTGGGMKLFCAGVGTRFPDIADASRRMTADEFKMCSNNGVDRIMEIQVGVDGIVFAEGLKGPKLSLTPGDIYLALAANPRGKPNTAKTWKDVNPALPAAPIQVYGPPATSGTRDALGELIMTRGCEALYPDSLSMKKKNPDAYKKTCETIRSDGAYIDSGENDNLIVQKLQANSNAVGIFGYSYLEENKANLAGVPIGGVTPSYETISGAFYPGARPLYIYVKKAHIDLIPGIDKFLSTYSKMWGPDGQLVKRGLIAAPQNVRDAAAAVIANRSVLDGDTLK